MLYKLQRHQKLRDTDNESYVNGSSKPEQVVG